jgi:hypothetical protein
MNYHIFELQNNVISKDSPDQSQNDNDVPFEGFLSKRSK